MSQKDAQEIDIFKRTAINWFRRRRQGTKSVLFRYSVPACGRSALSNGLLCKEYFRAAKEQRIYPLIKCRSVEPAHDIYITKEALTTPHELNYFVFNCAIGYYMWAENRLYRGRIHTCL